MMNRLITVVLTSLLISTAYAEDVVQTIDAAKDGHIDVSNISGEVTVRGWNRNSVEVTGTLGRNVEELILERDDDKILIKVKVPRKGGRGIDSDLHINVPQNSSINVGTVSADINVADVNGDQSLHTVSGDVETEYKGGDMRAESVSGDVDITGDGEEGDTRANTVSGDVTLFRLAGEVEAESVSGSVIVDEGSYSRAELGTVNGEIIFRAGLRDESRLSADTVNGEIDIEFDGDVSATFEIDTFNGSIRNCFGPKAERTSKYTPGLELEFTEGGGKGHVEISTMNGGVSLCKK